MSDSYNDGLNLRRNKGQLGILFAARFLNLQSDMWDVLRKFLAIVITTGAVIIILLILYTTYFRHGLPVSENKNQVAAVEQPQATNNSTTPATSTPATITATPEITPPPSPTTSLATTPLPSPIPTSRPLPNPTASPTELPSASLIIPVAGARPEQLRDTFNEARSEGRTHEAIDIAASHGAPVLAATDGTIVKLFFSERGGITIYQLGTDNRTVFYYAHLDRYAEDIYEKQFVRQGKTIGYVGDTGNAGAGNYHLHFAIWIVLDPKKYWSGINLNPYELLKRAP